MNPLMAMALTIPEVQNGINKEMKKFMKIKPDYYKISLSKQERKGKTPEEIETLRIEKYNIIKGE